MPSVLHPSRRTYKLSRLKCIVNTGKLTVGDLVSHKQTILPKARKAPPHRRFIKSDDSSDGSTTIHPQPSLGDQDPTILSSGHGLKGLRG